MKVHLVDGTYELFRAYYGAPPATSERGQEVGATRALMRSLASLLSEPEVTHVAVAYDHVIESFRNQLFAGYKTGEGIAPELYSQFELAEQATRVMGVVVWPMVEFEADDALATGAARYRAQREVEQVVLCSPDKDLAQCVEGDRVVCLDRMRKRVLDDKGVRDKFGVEPGSIPDWLALVGDNADGIPGVARWGQKSAANVLARYLRLEHIPEDSEHWEVAVRGKAALSETLRAAGKLVYLYRQLATLRRDVPLQEDLQQLHWRGPRWNELLGLCNELGESQLPERVRQLQSEV